MSKKRFIGLLLIITGLVVGLIGVGLRLQKVEKPTVNTSANEDTAKIDDYSEVNLVINLPAPESIVASPMLIRGKVYGSAEYVKLILVDKNQEILTEVNTDWQLNDKETQGYYLFQTSLIFNQPSGQNGWLKAQLLSNKQIINEQTIPIVFR